MIQKPPNINYNVVSITELLTELAGLDAHFVAAKEVGLPERLHLVFDGSHHARARANRYLTSIIGVEVENNTLGLLHRNTLLQTTYNRVPLYIVDSHPELDSVDIGSGRQNLQDAIEGDWDFTPSRTETIRLHALLEKFVNAGAVSVLVNKELLKHGDEPLIALRIGLETQKTFDIAGRFGSVRFDGSVYPLQFEPIVTGGPFGEVFEIGLYYENGVDGSESKTLDEGLDDLRRFLYQKDSLPR